MVPHVPARRGLAKAAGLAGGAGGVAVALLSPVPVLVVVYSYWSPCASLVS